MQTFLKILPIKRNNLVLEVVSSQFKNRLESGCWGLTLNFLQSHFKLLYFKKILIRIVNKCVVNNCVLRRLTINVFFKCAVKFNPLRIYPKRIFFYKCQTKTKNGQIELNKVKKLLHNKRNGL
jgi:hypothetical protein